MRIAAKTTQNIEKTENFIKKYTILKVKTPQTVIAVRVLEETAKNAKNSENQEKKLVDNIRSLLCLYNDMSTPTFEEWSEPLSLSHFLLKGGKMFDL